ncbi:pentapeptide repeat-containing protein [Capnocytophaga leadbetteri]|nr:pentapeptide repeat-containing protein [Capnocytophaga leadbetteri]
MNYELGTSCKLATAGGKVFIGDLRINVMKNINYKEKSWSTFTKFSKQNFDDFDFSNTVFENTAFESCIFQDCLFFKSNFNHIGLWGCDFINCQFISADMRNIPIGVDGGILKNCSFQKCNFQGQHFEYPFFDNCIFDKCKLKNINFNDSSFRNCKFIGKLEDVTFNGIYNNRKRERTVLENVDFSEAVFGDFVSFEDCDLSSSIPPKTRNFEEMLYVVDLNNIKILSTGTKDRFVIQKK